MNIKKQLKALAKLGNSFSSCRKSQIASVTETIKNMAQANQLADKVMILELILEIQAEECLKVHRDAAKANFKIDRIAEMLEEIQILIEE